jgi:hypothetical protein
MDEAFRFHPVLQTSLSDLADKVFGGPSPTSAGPLPDEVLLAAFAYTHATRSFQPVWGFLQIVMALEMLAQYLKIKGRPTARFQALLRQYCAPGVASNPLTAYWVSISN